MTVSATKLAGIFGVTRRRVDQLVDDKVIERFEGGFDFEDCTRRYITYLKRDEMTREERRKLLAAQTLLVALRAKRATGELMTRAQARQELQPLQTKLWALRVAAEWHRQRLLLEKLGPDRVHLLVHELYADLNGLIVKIRDDLDRRFRDPEQRELESEYERLDVQAPRGKGHA